MAESQQIMAGDFEENLSKIGFLYLSFPLSTTATREHYLLVLPNTD